jgi:hypothetical protein
MLVNSTAEVKEATRNARTVLTVLIQGVVFTISPTTFRKQKVSWKRKSRSYLPARHQRRRWYQVRERRPSQYAIRCKLELKKWANEPLLRCSMLVLPLQLSREKEKDITKVRLVNAQPVYQSSMEVENDEAL